MSYHEWATMEVLGNKHKSYPEERHAMLLIAKTSLHRSAMFYFKIV